MRLVGADLCSAGHGPGIRLLLLLLLLLLLHGMSTRGVSRVGRGGVAGASSARTALAEARTDAVFAVPRGSTPTGPAAEFPRRGWIPRLLSRSKLRSYVGEGPALYPPGGAPG